MSQENNLILHAIAVQSVAERTGLLHSVTSCFLHKSVETETIGSSYIQSVVYPATALVLCLFLLFHLLRMQQRHSFTAINSTFIVDAQYVFVKELGQGAYGCVVAAKHRQSGEGCAIKKITNINTKVSQPLYIYSPFAFIVILSIIYSLRLENFNETMSPRN